MPQGLEVYDEFGVLFLSTADFTFRYLGQVVISQPSRTSTTGGSLLVGGFGSGLPTAFFVANAPTPRDAGEAGSVGTVYRTPRITISGNTLLWDYPWPIDGNGNPALVGLVPGMTGSIVYGVR